MEKFALRKELSNLLNRLFWPPPPMADAPSYLHLLPKDVLKLTELYTEKSFIELLPTDVRRLLDCYLHTHHGCQETLHSLSQFRCSSAWDSVWTSDETRENWKAQYERAVLEHQREMCFAHKLSAYIADPTKKLNACPVHFRQCVRVRCNIDTCNLYRKYVDKKTYEIYASLRGARIMPAEDGSSALLYRVSFPVVLIDGVLFIEWSKHTVGTAAVDLGLDEYCAFTRDPT